MRRLVVIIFEFQLVSILKHLIRADSGGNPKINATDTIHGTKKSIKDVYCPEKEKENITKPIYISIAKV